MTYEEAAMAALANTALVQGVKSGRRNALREAPYIQDTLGFKPDTYTLKNMPIEIGPLGEGTLGVTHIAPEGKAVGMRISRYIPEIMMEMGRRYRATKEQVLNAIYNMARHTTEHEGYHVFSSPLAKGEQITEYARDIMESITTKGRYIMKKMLGDHKDADVVRDTNPYPRAWKMATLADWAPYEGFSGVDGYRGLVFDSQTHKFYKTGTRLLRSAAKAAWKKGIDRVSGFMPEYAPMAA